MKSISNRLTEEEKTIPTMKDVAELAGISITSVSHYLNNTRTVSPELQEKIISAIKQLNFHPNPIARMLRNGKSRVVGFVVSNLESSFYVRIAKGLESYLSQMGYDLILVDSAENKEKEIRNVKALYVRGVDALLIAPVSSNGEYLANVLPHQYPVAFVDRQVDDNTFGDTILLANQNGAKKATKYLLDKGITDIAFIALHFGSDTIDATMEERLDGYKHALIEANISINESYIKCIPGGRQSPISDLQYSSVYKITENLLQTPIKAILCGNSLAAIGVYSCLRDYKIKIPEEIAILTFDDELWLSIANPRISAITQPTEAMGVLAGQRLLERIKGNDNPYEEYRLNSELVIRDSC